LADLAIIKLDLTTRREPTAPVPSAKFGDSSKLKVGDVVLAMGSPGGLSQSVTRGIVANTEMIAPRMMGGGFVLDGENVGELVRWIGHDAIIYPGNSGGPLVNLAGEIVGVNEVGIASLGGAIPSNLAQHVAADLIKNGSVARSWIGVLSSETLFSGWSFASAVFAISRLGAASVAGAGAWAGGGGAAPASLPWPLPRPMPSPRPPPPSPTPERPRPPAPNASPPRDSLQA